MSTGETHGDDYCSICEYPFADGEPTTVCHTCGAPVHAPDNSSCSEWGIPMADKYGDQCIFCNSCGVGGQYVPSPNRRGSPADGFDVAEELSDRDS